MDEIYSLFDSCAPTGTETKQRDNKLLSLREQQIDRMTAEMIKKPAPKKAKHKVEDPTNLFTAASASMQEASAPMMSDKKKEVENPVQKIEKEQVTAQEDDINKKKTYEKEEIFKEVTEYFGAAPLPEPSPEDSVGVPLPCPSGGVPVSPSAKEIALPSSRVMSIAKSAKSAITRLRLFIPFCIVGCFLALAVFI